MDNNSNRLEFRLGMFGSFLPLLTLLGVILALVLTGWVHTKTLWVACLASMLVAIVLAKKPAEASEAMPGGMSRKMVAVMALAWILAGIMGKLLSASGLVDSLVWLGVNVGVSGAFLPLITFIIAALFSTATGTSGGSIAAIGLIMIIIPAVLIYIMYKGVHLVTALMTTNALGIVLGLVAGLLKPTSILFADVPAKKFGGILYSGINGMLPIIMFTMLLLGLVGIFDKAGLFQLILDKVSPFTKKVRNAELSVFILTIIGNIITAGSARSIVAIGPLAKELADRHNLAPKRNANIMDALATGTIMFVPYNPGVMLTLGIAMSTGIVASDFNIIQAFPFFFHGMGLFGVMLIAILTGWGREYKDEESMKEEHDITGV